jgi:RsiW-degrading membrane proteinase PrsW (M82 family)
VTNQPPPPTWTDSPPPPAVPPPPKAQQAGWYVDPWHPNHWRWYDGRQWTAHVDTSVDAAPVEKPRLPSFLSVPVLLAAIPSLPLLGYAAITNPITIVLGIVPFLIVAPALVWMDRVEPEPWSSRLHTFLWGAFVAGVISLVFNTVFALLTSETAAAVVSAPFIEELTKAGAILWMIRRREIDGIMDGLVYAGWAALGFAVIEDVSYFYLADEQDILFETFIGRALFTPFAHPLFTAWTGLAIGLAVRKGRSVLTAWWGLVFAMGSHAAWNGSLSLAEDEGAMLVAGVAVVAFVLLFVATIIGVTMLRRADQRRYVELLPQVGQRYNVAPDRLTWMTDPRSRRRARKALQTKEERRRFDDEASAIARLAALHDRVGAHDADHEARLVSQLAAARHP